MVKKKNTGSSQQNGPTAAETKQQNGHSKELGTPSTINSGLTAKINVSLQIRAFFVSEVRSWAWGLIYPSGRTLEGHPHHWLQFSIVHYYSTVPRASRMGVRCRMESRTGTRDQRRRTTERRPRVRRPAVVNAVEVISRRDIMRRRSTVFPW